jgi:hypothetical protein
VALVAWAGGCAFDAAPQEDAGDASQGAQDSGPLDGASDAPSDDDLDEPAQDAQGEDAQGEDVQDEDAQGEDAQGEDAPEGCGEGLVAPYQDNDGDGVGGQPVGGGVCVPARTLPEGLAASGGDCDDRDPGRWRALWLHEDRDSDGFSGPALRACVGESLPAWSALEPKVAPTLALEPRRWTTEPPDMVPSADLERWDELERLLARQGEEASCNAQEDERCERLVASDFGLALPEGATVWGVRVHVEGRQGEARNGGVGGPSVQARLRAPSGAWSAPQESAEPWRRIPEDHSFGGAQDTWGLALTRDDLNDPRFAVVLEPTAGQAQEPAVSALWLEVWHSEGSDCDDADPTRARAVYGYVDLDGDRFGAGQPVRACLEGERRLGVSSHPDDCYDANPQAHPYARQSHPTDRGDGSFDYNCDGQDTPALLGYTTACAGDPMAGCIPTTTTRAPDAPCGQPNELGACEVGADLTCVLRPATSPTSCK